MEHDTRTPWSRTDRKVRLFVKDDCFGTSHDFDQFLVTWLSGAWVIGYSSNMVGSRLKHVSFARIEIGSPKKTIYIIVYSSAIILGNMSWQVTDIETRFG